MRLLLLLKLDLLAVLRCFFIQALVLLLRWYIMAAVLPLIDHI